MDVEKVTQWYWDFDIDHGIPLEHFLELAERLYELGKDDGWCESIRRNIYE